MTPDRHHTSLADLQLEKQLGIRVATLSRGDQLPAQRQANCTRALASPAVQYDCGGFWPANV